MKKIILFLLIVNMKIFADINGFFTYQFGYTRANNTTVVMGTKQEYDKIGIQASEASGFISLSDLWFANFGFRYYSPDSLLPTLTYSEKEKENQKVANTIAFYIGKWSGKIPQVKIQKYNIASSNIVTGVSKVYNENKKLLLKDDNIYLSSAITKFSLIWGTDARMNTNIDKNIEYSGNIYKIISHVGINYYDIDAKFADTIYTHGNGYSTYLKKENFKAYGAEMSWLYFSSLGRSPMFISIGGDMEMAIGDAYILNAGYFISVGYNKNNSPFQIILTCQGNIFNEFDVFGTEYNNPDFASIGGPSYSVLGGVSYSF